MHFVIIKTFEIITLHTKYISHILYNINTFNIEDARDTILKKKKRIIMRTRFILLYPTKFTRELRRIPRILF